ncbi:oxygen-independent coproporphyrinogen III oxidase [bacterium (Candidatus Blackallbacteria) CG17_big_fil_post_rev_8_21_14_2_50_48_46]|uniref:Coproporphyrinogen-III oxidase n=1 Tax=bacterium (Candidatus Blackallbacteria) CG17_big_fil_post_rev_8_21_14_2_50_48_46 TaxID=2014261 RepID=A0A2M7GA30_9BACT|nr:MAG: oxygen-independent coproporphyrinogen III oxidase [bacterium (Candidatus Blackallbacteria) CG18_big_fil_WC_8_21_14_2_50_49_26]PIW19002.1 MAG: oxygen-independent coproporphyrinogen III oxidase [bacterium (Candidatus Blackallbacteria) CG17_big_fil_post_rev_8_21_14_2_50_48_46]PIW44630.1 MAG: oxygen-independent coproporphyrinogen III oxidase [bacterium (Candidatus Blackallbacteria) CG13_big_fil_rev_8_21_14_2_50_49_14]
MPEALDFHVPRDLLAKYAKPGPRYTSYPTAPVWRDDFGPEQAEALYRANNPENSTRALALYFHMPFCTSLCWYCGCNVKISRNKAVLGPYLEAVERELELVSPFLASGREISQMHWGGGTPTYLSPEQIVDVVAMIKKRMRFSENAELSIEVDPRVTTLEHLQALRASGFNRISMGVQDFNPEVQEAVHRVQRFEDTAELIANSRKLGFLSVNIDLMYGLPYQTVASFSETLKQVASLDPDRLALFHYAHVPWLKPAQKLIKEETLPSSETKLDIFELAIDDFLQKGYRYIGMDHFAKPDDELSLAQQEHTLRRNFMGYTTQAGTDLYGFGVSSISEIEGHFIQNERLVPDYEARLKAGHLPTLRGMVLSADDHLRKAVIEDLICNCYLDYARLEKAFEIDFKTYFAAEIAEMETLVDDQLVAMSPSGVQVLPRGQILIRNVCMIWDAYLKQQQGKQQFSRTA